LHRIPTINYINIELPPYWAKVAALKQHLEDAELVFFVDTDAVLASLMCGVAEVQALLHGGVELVTATDAIMWPARFNAGVFVIKSSPLMRQMIDFWMSLYDRTRWTRFVRNGVYEWSTTGLWGGSDYEQGSFIRSILDNATFSGVHRRLSWEVLQQFTPSSRSNITFTYHFAGIFKTSTMQIFRQSVENGTYDETCNFDVARALRIPLLDKHK